MASHEVEPTREYVGSIWYGDDWEATLEGIVVDAVDLAEARRVVSDACGPEARISLWNEEDAERLRQPAYRPGTESSQSRRCGVRRKSPRAELESTAVKWVTVGRSRPSFMFPP